MVEETRWRGEPTTEHDGAWSPNGGEYVLGFASALNFRRSQMFCRLCKSTSDETENEIPRMYTQGKDKTLPLKNPAVHLRVWWILKKQRNVTACTRSIKVFRVLKSDTVEKEREETLN